MKIAHLMFIALFTCMLSLSAFSADTYATSAMKEVTASTEKVKKDWFKWLHKEPTKNVVEIPKEMVALANQLAQQVAKQ